MSFLKGNERASAINTKCEEENRTQVCRTREGAKKMNEKGNGYNMHSKATGKVENSTHTYQIVGFLFICKCYVMDKMCNSFLEDVAKATVLAMLVTKIVSNKLTFEVHNKYLEVYDFGSINYVFIKSSGFRICFFPCVPPTKLFKCKCHLFECWQRSRVKGDYAVADKSMVGSLSSSKICIGNLAQKSNILNVTT